MVFGRTGEQCSVTGKYRRFGNYEVQVTLREGELFPQPVDASDAFWILSGKPEDDQPVRTTGRYKGRYNS